MTEVPEVDVGNRELEDFLADLASSKPAPGGGSASAVVGALSAALASMVANLTVGKEEYSDVEEKYETILKRADRLRGEFIAAVEEDITAYNRVMEAYGMPKETDEEKEKRKKAIQSALKEATVPPFKMADLALEVLALSEECAVSGNRHAVTDAGASAILAEATVRSSLLNVDINLSSISDADFVSQKGKKREEVEDKAKEKAAEVAKIMEQKI